MSKAFAYARGKINRGEATRIGQIITPRNFRAWEKRIEKAPGFLQRRVDDPHRWRIVDAFNLAQLLDVDPEKIEKLVNAEIAYREAAGINSLGSTPSAWASR